MSNEEFDDLRSQPDVSAAYEDLQQLQADLEYEKDARLQERFCFLLTLIVLLDVFFFISMDGWGGPVAILILEVILVLVLAKVHGMKETAEIMDRVLSNNRPNGNNG